MTSGTFIYLYCVTDQKPVLNKLSFGSDILYSINDNELYAIVSNVSEEDFSEGNLERNIADMEWLEKHIRIHNDVINKIMLWGKSVVIPFKFATVFLNEDSLKSFLTDYSQSLRRNIEYLKDKEEWGIKIYCDKIRMEKDILANDPDIRAMEAEIEASTPGKAFFIKKKKKELLAAILLNKANEYAKGCYQSLEKLSVKAKTSKVQPKEVTGKESDMILNAVFLINVSNISEFTNVILELRSKYNPKGFDIECSGPWPAYNFCNIEKKDNK